MKLVADQKEKKKNTFKIACWSNLGTLLLSLSQLKRVQGRDLR